MTRDLDAWRAIAEDGRRPGSTRFVVGACDRCGAWAAVRGVTRGPRAGQPAKPLPACPCCAEGTVAEAVAPALLERLEPRTPAVEWADLARPAIDAWRAWRCTFPT